MPSAAGIRRRRALSARLYWAARYLTMACAVVSRTVLWVVLIMAGFLRDSPRAAVDDDGLFFGHFGDGRADTFLADAAALQPAVGHQVGPPQRGPVDVDVAGVDLAHRAYRCRYVGGENACAQAVFVVIGDRDRGGDVGGRGYRDRGPEQLVAGERRLWVDRRDHRGRDDRAVAVAAGEHFRPGLAGHLDRRGHPGGLGLGDQRPQPGVLPGRVAQGDGVDLGHQRVEEVGFHAFVDDHPLHRDAHLAGVDVAPGGHGRCGHVDVGVG